MNIIVRDWNVLTTGEKMAHLQHKAKENKKKLVWQK
jgi:hypothetical protein